MQENLKFEEPGPNALIIHLVMSMSSASSRSIRFNLPMFFGSQMFDQRT